jgi:hypothetical protein
MQLHSLWEITAFLTGNFGKKTPAHMIFFPHVQLDQNAILDKLFWTQLFWLGIFSWFFLPSFF